MRYGRIEIPRENDHFYCRYLVCKSLSALKEIANGELSGIPSSSPFLAKTVSGEFLAAILQRYSKPYKKPHPDSHIWGDTFKDRGAYEVAHPDVRVFNRSSISLFPYFEASRVPTREELSNRVAPADPVSAALLEAGVPECDISEAFAYEEECGAGGFREIYRIRPVWGVYLSATNIAD